MLSSPTPVGAVADQDERLFWALMRRFEALAVDRYAAHAPDLATPFKRDFVASLDEAGASEATLATHPLARPTDALLATARGEDELTTLIVQGLVLEGLGQAIYRIVTTTDRTVSEASRRLAAAGRSASESVTSLVPARLTAHTDGPDALWTVFADASQEVLGALDDLADPVDATFGARFGLRFGEVMGEFTADLVDTCTALGLPRRKLVAHLAGAAMGI